MSHPIANLRSLAAALLAVTPALLAVPIALLAVTLSSAPAYAWGREGHRLTALVAEHYLTPEARAQVAELLHRQSLADVASWADGYREDHAETAPWHFVDIPSSAAVFDRNRDCPLNRADPASPWRDCVTDRILFFEGQLADPDLPTPERAVALKFLVHLIGDVHQPMHTLGDARGGNGIPVFLLGSQTCGTAVCNLHNVWDDGLIDEEHLPERRFVDHLLDEIALHHWDSLAGGQPVLWANASHRLAVEALAPRGAYLNRDYVTAESAVVDQQLALGGLRLARVLNRILTAPDGGPAGLRTTIPKPPPR